MNAFKSGLLAAALYATTASADAVKVCPTSDLCYHVGVPQASAASSNLYFQMTAPADKYTWVALGTGQRMAGSNIFLMYQDGNGNITLSPRRASGHFMPSAVQDGAALELLEGSGVVDGVMTANVRCTNCQSWSGGSMSLSSSSTDWLAAWKAGSPLQSTNLGAQIQEHDDHSQFNIDLTQATISSDANPFVGGGGNSTGGDSSDPGSSGDNPSGGDGGSSGDGDGDDGGSGGGVEFTGGSGTMDSRLLAHGIIMSIVWVIMYPVGSLLMPMLGKWMIHAAWQTLAFVAMWAGLGLGVVIGKDIGILFKETHTLMGTVVVCLMVLQPFLGFAHHTHFKKHQKRSLLSHAHIWYGRALMIIGIVNGGLGLRLARAHNAFIIAYSVIAAVVFVLYGVGSVFSGRRRERRTKEVYPDSPVTQRQT